jgi:hypothetical protein
VSNAGGLAEIESSPGGGTMVSIHWPHASAHSAPDYDDVVNAMPAGTVAPQSTGGAR